MSTSRRLSLGLTLAGILLGPAAAVAQGLLYHPLTPCRVVDTRSGSPLQNGVPQTFALHGVCGIPATAPAVALNVTSTLATGAGDLTIYPSDATPPAFATFPLPVNDAERAGSYIAQVSNGAGELTVQASVAGNGTVHLVLDVTGYFDSAE